MKGLVVKTMEDLPEPVLSILDVGPEQLQDVSVLQGLRLSLQKLAAKTQTLVRSLEKEQREFERKYSRKARDNSERSSTPVHGKRTHGMTRSSGAHTIENDSSAAESDEAEDERPVKRERKDSEQNSESEITTSKNTQNEDEKELVEIDEYDSDTLVDTQALPDTIKLPNPKSITTPLVQLPSDQWEGNVAVKSFPIVDMMSLLPGPVPNEDFSKVKQPANQISSQTFSTYIEPYFRLYTDEDLQSLKSHYAQQDEVSPYLIPTKGPHYLDVWNAENIPQNNNLNRRNISTGKDSIQPKGNVNSLNDENLFTEDVSCGPLAERIISALISEDILANSSKKENNLNGTDETNLAVDMTESKSPGSTNNTLPFTSKANNWNIQAMKLDYMTLEERLRRELSYIGLLSDDVDWSSREDDEICATLRSLQKELREITAQNAKRKEMLAEKVSEQLAYQEYLAILDELNKQIESGFLKRLRSAKSHKKKKPTENNVSNGTPGTSTPGTPQNPNSTSNDAMRQIMRRREKWISKIGSLFEPSSNYTHPEVDLFENDDIKSKG